MRLCVHVALELALLATLVVGVTLGGRAGARLARAFFGSPMAGSGAFIASDEEPVELPAPEPPPVARDAPGTFLGMDDEVLMARLRELPIVRIKANHGGTSISLRLELTDGSRAAFKPNQINPQSIPRKEVAAFRLDRLLGLGHVAPSVPRRISRDEIIEKMAPEQRHLLPRVLSETIFDEDGSTSGEAQYFIPQIRDTELESADKMAQWTLWLSAGAPPPPPEWRGLAEQLSTLVVFDLLTNNSDRMTGGNLVASPDLRFLYFLDNTFGFQTDPQGNYKCRQMLLRVQRFSRSLVHALERLDGPSLQAALAREPAPPYEILTAEEIAAVISRRDVALGYIRDLVSRFGAEAVLTFP